MVDDYIAQLRLNNARSNCIESSIVLFPCVSLTPSSYTLSYSQTSNALSSNSTITADTDELQPHLLTLPMKYKEAIKAQWQALHDVGGMDLNFKVDRLGAGMNVDMGGLKLDLFVKDNPLRKDSPLQQQLLETGIFLGVDSQW